MTKGKSTKKSFSEKKSTGNQTINDLILFGIYSVNNNNEKCTFDRLIKECFTFNPKIICFSRYSKWPDARKLDRPLRELRNKKLISGNPKTSFVLTIEGKKIAESNFVALKQKTLNI